MLYMLKCSLKLGQMMTTDCIGWQEELPFDAQQRREVFARFGLTMYYAQCLEQQIGMMLASMYNREFLEVESEDRDRFFEREIAKTLGRMAKDLKTRAGISPTLNDRLCRAVEIRNWLAYDYFYQRSLAINSLEGREKMITELQEQADFLQDLDQEFTDIMYKWMKYLGITKEAIEAEKKQFYAENNLDPG